MAVRRILLSILAFSAYSLAQDYCPDLGGQEWFECGSPCTKTCEEPNPMCIEMCQARCQCPNSAPIWHEGECIEQARCPKATTTTTKAPQTPVCEGGQEWLQCGSPCISTCEEPSPMCMAVCEARCQCPRGRPIWHEGECIEQARCPKVTPPTPKPIDCEGGQEWFDCVTPCDPTCDNRNPVCTEICGPRCKCPRGRPYLLEGQCVEEERCPEPCPVPMCLTQCDSYMRNERGCQTCECEDPCNLMDCAPGSTCVSKTPHCREGQVPCPSPVAECVRCEVGAPLSGQHSGTLFCADREAPWSRCPSSHECKGYSDHISVCCQKVDYPKGPCHEEFLRQPPFDVPDAWYPDCTEDGSYEPMQCYGFLGECWCVNTEDGKEIEGTRRSDMRNEERPNCEVPVEPCQALDCALSCENGYKKNDRECDICECKEQECEPNRCRLRCEHGYVQNDRGCDICECKEQECEPIRCRMSCKYGYVQNDRGCDICECREPECEPISCPLLLCQHGFKKNEHGCYICECLEERPCAVLRCAERCPLGYRNDDYDCATCHCKEPRGPCHHEYIRQSELSQIVSDVWLPDCREDGSYAPLQCDTFARSCWCVITDDGTEVEGTRRSGDEPRPVCREEPEPCRALECDLECEFGFRKNDLGCDICECKEEEPCHRVACDRECRYGYQQDRHGCPTCECVELECPDLQCELGQCEFGQAKENGCFVCKCNLHPCATMKCEPGSECQLLETPCRPGSECQPIPECVRVAPLCEKGEPMKDHTGRQLDCGMSPDRDTCPETHYCLAHPADHYAVCCQREDYPRGPCHEELLEIGFGRPGAFKPSCTEDGMYNSVQCHASTGECWCAREDGTEIENTRGRDRRITCDETPTTTTTTTTTTTAPRCPMITCSFCREGYKLDSHGCETCECAEPDTTTITTTPRYECVEPTCSNPCPRDEYRRDEYGCRTCDCAAPPHEECRGGQVWQWCGSACNVTCEDLMPICTRECAQRCECPEHIPVFMDGECRPTSACDTSDSESSESSESKECADVMCDRHCRYGFAEEEGCPVCRCNPDPCENHECEVGYVCRLREVQCVRAPCPPIASCEQEESMCEVGDPLRGVDGRRLHCGRGYNCPETHYCSHNGDSVNSVCCQKEDYPRGPCHKELLEIGHIPRPGDYRPTCTEDGMYADVQCHGSTGECWCVKPDGTEIAYTRVSRERVNCDEPEKCTSVDCGMDCEYGLAKEEGCEICRCAPHPCEVTECKRGFVCKLQEVQCLVPPCYPVAHCEREEQMCEVGEPLRDHHGRQVQCGGQRPACPDTHYCVNQVSVCCQKEDYPRGPCHKELLEIGVGMPGQFKPSCTEDGMYSSVQCHVSTGHCWCATEDGDEIENTRVQHTRPSCDEPVRECPGGMEWRDCGSACNVTCDDLMPRCTKECVNRCQCPDDTPVFMHGRCQPKSVCETDVHICEDGDPLIDADGTQVFCGRGPTRQDCPNTHVCKIHRADRYAVCCKKSDQPHGPCHEKLRDSKRPGLLGAYVPSCTDDGMFEQVQCHGSSGYCWCAKPDGTEIEGTKVRGQQPVCDQDTDKECKPVVCRMACKTGYVKNSHGCDMCECVEPKCPTPCKMGCEYGYKKDANGCSICQCQERLTKCEREQAEAKATSDRQRDIQDDTNLNLEIELTELWHYIPECKADGSYSERQCSELDMCWCVDQMGVVIPNTQFGYFDFDKYQCSHVGVTEILTTLRLLADYKTYEKNPEKFKSTFTESLSDELQIPEQMISIIKVMQGSIIVETSITPEDKEMANDVINRLEWFGESVANGEVTFEYDDVIMEVESESLDVTYNMEQVDGGDVLKTREPEPLGGLTQRVVVIVVCVGALAIIMLFIALATAMCRCKKRTGKASLAETGTYPDKNMAFENLKYESPVHTLEKPKDLQKLKESDEVVISPTKLDENP